jgi:hypothetical protein
MGVKNMGVKKLNNMGLSHLLLPGAVVVVFAIAGVAYLVSSSAATKRPSVVVPYAQPVDISTEPVIDAQSGDPLGKVFSAGKHRKLTVIDDGNGPLGVIANCSSDGNGAGRRKSFGLRGPGDRHTMDCLHDRYVYIQYMGQNWAGPRHKWVRLSHYGNSIALPNFGAN